MMKTDFCDNFYLHFCIFFGEIGVKLAYFFAFDEWNCGCFSQKNVQISEFLKEKNAVKKRLRRCPYGGKSAFYTKNKYFFVIPLAILRKVCYNVIELFIYLTRVSDYIYYIFAGWRSKKVAF